MSLCEWRATSGAVSEGEAGRAAGGGETKSSPRTVERTAKREPAARPPWRLLQGS